MAKQQYLSKARTWEQKLKSGEWGVLEHEMPLLSYELKDRMWAEAILQGPKCLDPSPETLALIEAELSGETL